MAEDTLNGSVRKILNPAFALIKLLDNGEQLSIVEKDFILSTLRLVYGFVEKKLREVPNGKVS